MTTMSLWNREYNSSLPGVTWCLASVWLAVMAAVARPQHHVPLDLHKVIFFFKGVRRNPYFASGVVGRGGRGKTWDPGHFQLLPPLYFIECAMHLKQFGQVFLPFERCVNATYLIEGNKLSWIWVGVFTSHVVDVYRCFINHWHLRKLYWFSKRVLCRACRVLHLNVELQVSALVGSVATPMNETWSRFRNMD